VNESELIELLKNNKFDNATLSSQGVVHISSTVPRAPYNYVRDANTYYVTARYGEYYTIISGSKKLELRVHRTLLELMFERGCKFGNACLTPNHKVKVDGTIDKTVGNLLSIRVPVQYIRYSVDNHWYMVAYDKPAPQGVFLFDEDSISAMRQHIKRCDARIDAVKTKSAMMKKYYFCLLGKIYVEDFQNMDTHERTVNLLAVRVSILRDYIKTGGISCRDFLTLLFDESDIRTDKNWDILTHWESDGIKLDRFELFAEYVRFMLDLSAYFEEEGSICSKVILMQ
jgi:hypothetical protein